jgi:hypothetical protein
VESAGDNICFTPNIFGMGVLYWLFMHPVAVAAEAPGDQAAYGQIETQKDSVITSLSNRRRRKKTN